MKKTVSLLLLLPFLIFNFNIAEADEDKEKLWDKGRNQTTEALSQNIGDSVGIVSVSSYYSSGRGMNRIRVWSRTPLIKSYFDNAYEANPDSTLTWVSNVYITNEGLAGAQTFGMDNTAPQATGGIPEYISSPVYDIMGYFSIPTGIVEAITNQVFAKVVVTLSNMLESETVELKNIDYARDLPLGVYYDDAEIFANGTLSGYEAKFWYDLGVGEEEFPMAAKGQINYTYKYFKILLTVPTDTFSNEFLVNDTTVE